MTIVASSTAAAVNEAATELASITSQSSAWAGGSPVAPARAVDAALRVERIAAHLTATNSAYLVQANCLGGGALGTNLPPAINDLRRALPTLAKPIKAIVATSTD